VTCRPGNETVLSKEKADQSPSRRYRQNRTLSDARRRRIPQVGLRPSFVTPAAALCHPDCRWPVILIVALQARTCRSTRPALVRRSMVVRLRSRANGPSGRLFAGCFTLPPKWLSG
jgi:hypothetical protein